MNLTDLREISFEEHKKLQFDILKNVAKFCEENKLTYWLAYGTLIGAIRHKGFIPWDDDIDLWMPRKDYNLFIKLYNEKNESSGRYFCVDPVSNLARHSMIKVIDCKTIKIEPGVQYKDGYLGVDVDVFPLDGQPDGDEEYQSWYFKLMKLYKRYVISVLDFNIGSIKRRLLGPIYKVFLGNKKRLMKKSQELHSMYSFNQSKFVGCVEMLFNVVNDRYPRVLFEESIDVEFEGMFFKAPKGYDGILKRRYGDYMQLPPIEEQVTHHTNRVFWR